jgi:hypothetical protein
MNAALARFPCLLPLLSLAVALDAAASEIPLAWGPHRDLAAVPAEGGSIEITLGEGHPHFWTGIVPSGFDPGRHEIFEMETFAPSGLRSATLRFRVDSGEMVVAGTADLPPGEAWQPWTFDLSQVPVKPAANHPEMRFHVALHGKAGSVMRLRRFRVREMNPAERERKAGREAILRERQEDARRIREDLAATWPARITRVEVGPEEITIQGRTPRPAGLVGIPPETPSHRASSRDTTPDVVPDAAGEFRVVRPRRDPASRRDHALWRWRLADPASGSWLSAASWPTDTAPGVGGTRPRAVVPHPKGLGGIPPLHQPDHEIFELGIGHATVNIVLNALLRETPAPGHVPWNCEGRTYHGNEAQLRSLDRTLGLLEQKGIVVSAILLVGNHRHPDGTPHSLMTHPEAEARGIYSIPNLTSEPATRLYAAAIRLLAERYDGTAGRPPGRIHHWILHNEIDQAGTWTNMGDQPLDRYLETYMRSARIVHHVTRLFDRQSRVFISLTHHWTKPSHGTGTYVVRELLERFAFRARAEGDFEWGVAYHPYPRDLRNPDTWKDEEVDDTFDTPHITPRNLEVLPAFLKQERFLHQGRVRGILLSEQGFNTPTLSEEDQRRQAAGLVYVFRKLARLPEIEAYHLHRYQDMPEAEGGLRLGLVTETGARKLAWEVYREIGTGSEAEQAHARMAEEVWSKP